jgi:mannosyltransferase
MARRPGPYIALGLLLVLGALLRFALLARQSYWYDETVTVELVHKSFGRMLAALPHSESTPPLYYVVAWAWARIFGFREGGLRSLSATCGAATIPAAFSVGRSFVSSRAGLFAAALVACSPLLVWYSQEARSYALFALLAALSAAVLAHALRHAGGRALTAWASIASLALATHYFAVFLVAVESALLLRAHPRLRRAWVAVAVPIVVGVCLLPLALHQQRTGQTTWIGAKALSSRIQVAARQFETGQYMPAHHVTALIAFAGAALAGLALVRFADRRERLGVLQILVIGGGALVAPLALAPTRYDEFFYRNLIGAWVLILVAFAAAMAARGTRALGLAAVGIACMVELAAVLIVADRPSLQRDDWRAATRAVGVSPAPFALVTPKFLQLPIKLYRPDASSMPATGSRIAQIVFLGFGHSAVKYRPPARFRLVERRQIQHIELLRFRATTMRRLTPATVGHERGEAVGVLVLP